MMHLTKHHFLLKKMRENNASYSVLTMTVQKAAFSVILENYLEESVLSPLVSKNTIIDFCRKSNRLLYSLRYVETSGVSLQCITFYMSPWGLNN